MSLAHIIRAHAHMRTRVDACLFLSLSLYLSLVFFCFFCEIFCVFACFFCFLRPDQYPNDPPGVFMVQLVKLHRGSIFEVSQNVQHPRPNDLSNLSEPAAARSSSAASFASSRGIGGKSSSVFASAFPPEIHIPCAECLALAI